MTIEVTAKKVEDAIKQGLAQLGAELDDVQVEVLEYGGLFRKAKVRLTLEKEEAAVEQPKAEQPKKDQPKAAEQPKMVDPPKAAEQPKKEQPRKEQPKKEQQPKAAERPQKAEQPKKEQPKKDQPKEQPKKVEPPKAEQPQKHSESNAAERGAAVEQARAFVETLVQKMGFEGATVEVASGDIAITAPAGDDARLIGRHGETLSAITFLAETMCRAEKHHVNFVVDCNGYRERRAASLTAMAHRRADECVAKHRKIKLDPMERVDRRTVHNALTEDERVTTASEGKEPYRCVVILPKKQ